MSLRNSELTDQLMKILDVIEKAKRNNKMEHGYAEFMNDFYGSRITYDKLQWMENMEFGTFINFIKPKIGYLFWISQNSDNDSLSDLAGDFICDFGEAKREYQSVKLQEKQQRKQQKQDNQKKRRWTWKRNKKYHDFGAENEELLSNHEQFSVCI